MRPTLRQLEYLVAVAEHLHFGRAAAACSVSQPGLSIQVRQAEEILGVRVFERATRRVLVTPEGESVIRRAREILERVDALGEEARASREPLSGRLRLGVIPTVAPYFLPRLLPRVRTAFPALRLFLREDFTLRMLDRLRSGGLDLLFLALPVGGDDLATMPLFDETFVLACPESDPLAARRRITTGDLEMRTVLLLEDGHCLRDQALAVCRNAGMREAGGIQATSLGTLVQMVANGLGLTLLPESAVPVEVSPETQVAVRAFPEPQPRRTLGLVWRAGTARADEYAMFGEFVKSHAARRRSDEGRGRTRGRRPRSVAMPHMRPAAVGAAGHRRDTKRNLR